ncbi:hypothetical protein U4T44_13490 [Klebsiella pneumoniae]|nr:hypothetical protein [Klebsiella pneumoniae]HDY4998467.1 hypothetical protein [Klebsiella pneumoniae]
MRTLRELKTVIGYQQTDACFLDYLSMLSEAGIITLNEGDIDGGTVSETFYDQLIRVWGIPVDEKAETEGKEG